MPYVPVFNTMMMSQPPPPTAQSMGHLYVNPKGKKPLHPSFRPGPYDVICARGKAAYDHEGNKRFRAIVRMHKDAYSNALTKYHKSQIVSKITNAIRQASPEGGFVKLIDQRWHEVGDRTAKEKIGQTFRDLLDEVYSSSTKAKARARIQKRVDAYRSESPEQPARETTVASTASASPRRQQQQQDKDEDAENTSSSVSVVSHESGSARDHDSLKKDHRRRMPSQIDIRQASTVNNLLLPTNTKRAEPCLFDTFSRLIDSAHSSDDFEPLPLNSRTFVPMVYSDHSASSSDGDDDDDESSLDELKDICDYVGVSC